MSPGIHAKTSSADTAGSRSHSHIIRVQVSKGPSDYNYQCFVEFGQFNGTVGNVMDIICSRGKSPHDEFPNFILVEFPKCKGPPFMEDHPTWIHVPAIDRRLDCQCCKRRQPGSIAPRICDNNQLHRLQGTMH